MDQDKNQPSDDLIFVAGKVGSIWEEFRSTIPVEHAKLYEEGLALVFLTYPDSLVINQLMELLIDENITSMEKSMSVRMITYDQIMDIVNKIGIVINKDFVELRYLQQLISLADFFYVVSETENAEVTFLPILLAGDVPPEQRLITALAKDAYPELDDPDMSDYECLIEEVPLSVIKSLIESIEGTEEEDIPDPVIIRRVKLNRQLLDTSIGYMHVRNGGAVGNSLEVYFNFFMHELSASMVDTPEQFILDVISIHLISEVGNDTLKDKIRLYLDGNMNNVVELMKSQSLIDAIQLGDNNE